MLSILYYIFLLTLCVVLWFVTLVTLILCSPFDRGRRAVHEITRAMSYLYFTIPCRWKMNVQGRELVDPKQPYVIVLNHQAMMDIPMLYLLPLNFRWVSKREVFNIPIFGQFLFLHGDIPIERGNGREAMKKLDRLGTMWLRRGISISIFPEGTRSKDGEIARFKSGAFNLAKSAGVAILPVVLDGSSTAIKRNRMFNWRNNFEVKVLPPISAERVQQSEVKDIMNEVHDKMVDALKSIRE